MDFKSKVYKEVEKEFVNLGYEKIEHQSGYLFVQESIAGVEGIRTSQIVTSKTYNEFFISLSLYRRYDLIEKPLSSILSMFSNSRSKISKTISLSHKALDEIESDEFYEKKSGRLVFAHSRDGIKNLVDKLDYYNQGLRNKMKYFDDIRNVDTTLNSSFELNESIASMFADTIPISIKRLFIARLADNPKQNELLNATKDHFIAESEKYEGHFREIFINYLKVLERLVPILISTKPLKDPYLLADDKPTT